MELDFSALNINPEASPSPEVQAPTEIEQQEIPSNVEVNINDSTEPIANEDETGVLDNIAEIPKAILRGAEKAANSTVDLVASGVSFASDVIDKGWDASEFKDVESPIRIPDQWIPDVNTPTGQIVSDISQFATEFIGLGKLKVFNLAKAGTKAAYGVDLARGALADIVGFKAQTENLTSHLVEAFPSLESPITDFLKNDGTDDHVSGRLKNALEGVGLGVAADGILRSFKVIRSFMKHGNDAEAIGRDIDRIASEASEQANEIAENGAEVASRTTEQNAVEEVTNATEEAVQHSKSDIDKVREMFSAERRADTPLTETDLLTIHKAAVAYPKLLDELTENINFRNFAWDTDQGRTFMQGLHMEIAGKLANSHKQSFGELMLKAAKNAEDAGWEDVAEGYSRTNLNIALDEVPNGLEVAQRLIYHDLQLRSEIPHLAESVNNLAERILGGSATDKDIAKFLYEGKRLQEVYISSRDIGTLLARGLNSRRIIPDLDAILHDFGKLTGKLPENSTEFKAILESNGIRREDIEKVAMVVRTTADPKRQMAMARTLAAPTWTKQFNFWFTQNILTGINTHLFNIGGNAIKTTLMASERVLGAMIRDAMKSDSHELRYALDYAGGLFSNIAYAAKMALAAVKTDTSGLETSLRSYGSKFDIPGRNNMMLNSSESFATMFAAREAAGEKVSQFERFIAKGMSSLGIFGRGNARVMLGEDEFFRQLHFQSSKSEIIRRKLDEAGYKRGSKEWQKAFDKEEKAFFDENGLIDMSNKDAQEALNTANRSAYTEDVTNGTVQKIINATNSSPALKIMMPFIKTVWNVSVDSVEHIPLVQSLSKNYRDAFAGRLGVRAQEEAVGKLAFGSMLSITALMLADNGYITGALSSNAKERDAQMRAGLRPYSIRIGDTWVSYQRADPVSACLGAAANYVTLLSNKEVDDEEMYEKASYVLGSFVAAIADKSFLTGLHDALDAAFSGSEAGLKVAEFAGKQAASSLPASGLVNQLWRNWLPNMTNDEIGDSYYHDKDKSMWAGLRTSGYASILNSMGIETASTPLKYDWITGEPLRRTVIASEDKTNDFVIGELERESKAVFGPPQRSLHNIRLTPEEYSRYCELHGTVQINGKTMMESLEDLMHSDAYDYKREHITDDSDAEGRTYRGDMIRKVMREYRNLAEQTLYEEFPELKAEIVEQKTQQMIDRSANPVLSGRRNEASWGQELLDTLNP